MSESPRGAGRPARQDFELEAWFAPRRAGVEAWLSARFQDAWPAAFGEALAYPLATPGKRVRPVLCLGVYEAVSGGDWRYALDAAASLELVHTYSLVHDDLPAMDDDDERRGRPTVHKVWDDATAILVGDALLTEAFTVLAEASYPASVRVELVRLLASASGYRGMVGGQAADVGVGGRIADEAGVLRLHRLKTGALLEASVLAGAIAGGASAEQRELLGTYGRAIGLAFQLADDLLDADEDAGQDGPPSFVTLLGADETRRRAQALAAEASEAVRAAVGDRAAALDALAAYIVDRKV
jgi:geranylgeranyl pyrophosphate synthase